jgi:hypothetical protein
MSTKLYEDMTDDDWDRRADKMLTKEQRQETEEESGDR